MISSETAKILQELLDDPSVGTGLPKRYAPERISQMCKEGLLTKSGWFEEQTTYEVSALGKDALDDFKHQREQESEAKAKDRFDKKIAICNLFISAISFVIGILTEYHVGICEIIAKLFKA